MTEREVNRTFCQEVAPMCDACFVGEQDDPVGARDWVTFFRFLFKKQGRESIHAESTEVVPSEYDPALVLPRPTVPAAAEYAVPKP